MSDFVSGTLAVLMRKAAMRLSILPILKQVLNLPNNPPEVGALMPKGL